MFMTKCLKIAEPVFTLKVTPEEKEAARKMRQLFEIFQKTGDELSRYLKNFFDTLNNTKNTDNIQKIGPLLKKYIHKYRDLCNEYITHAEQAIQFLTCSFKDTDTTSMRDLI